MIPDLATTVQEMLARFDAGDPRALEAFFAEGCRVHFPGVPHALDRAGYLALAGAILEAFPDLRHTVLETVREGDRVAVRTRLEGTHLAAFQGIAATGRRISLEAIALQRFAGGRCVDDRVLFDRLELLRQLGAAPDPGAAAAHEATLRASHEAFNARDYARAMDLVADDSSLVSVPLGLGFRGRDGYRTYLQGWATAFPDARTEVTSLAVAGDRAVVEFTGRGTQTGPLPSALGVIPPTGRRVEVAFCDVVELRGGRMLRTRSYFDAATMLGQLGVLPAAAGAPG